jgi:nifR3 family TIM-barrel protein
LEPIQQFDEIFARETPVLALAPMQDVTDLPFWNLMAKYGGPDLYFTEYFRVHTTSHLEKPILRSITDNVTGQPSLAQMIGNDVPSLVRSAKELQHYPIAGVDLNLGCPAPVVYRKCAGGGLLRDPARVSGIIEALREAVQVKFTIKTRIGFDHAEHFSELLKRFDAASPDLVTVHARTVHEMYRPRVHYEYVREAVERLRCPVLANGNVDCVVSARMALEQTGARGLMIGRGAIRNPWIFQQIRQSFAGEEVFVPRGRDVLNYVRELYEAVKPPVLRENAMVQKMKKYMNYLAVGVDPAGQFLHDIRRVTTEKEFFSVCERFLDHGDEMFMEPAFHPKVGGVDGTGPVDAVDAETELG